MNSERPRYVYPDGIVRSSTFLSKLSDLDLTSEGCRARISRQVAREKLADTLLELHRMGVGSIRFDDPRVVYLFAECTVAEQDVELYEVELLRRRQ